MDIDEFMLNTVFSYWTPTNEQKNIIIVDKKCISYINHLNSIIINFQKDTIIFQDLKK